MIDRGIPLLEIDNTMIQKITEFKQNSIVLCLW